MSTRQSKRQVSALVPDPSETVWFRVSSTDAPQGSILQTNKPFFVVARHLCMWRDWKVKE